MRNTFQAVRIARKCKSLQNWANLAGLLPQVLVASRIQLIYKQPTDVYWCTAISIPVWVPGRGNKWCGCRDESGRKRDNLALVTQEDVYLLVYAVNVLHRQVMLRHLNVIQWTSEKTKTCFYQNRHRAWFILYRVAVWRMDSRGARREQVAVLSLLQLPPNSSSFVHATIFGSLMWEPAYSLRCFELRGI